MKPIRALFWLITGLLGGAGATAWLLRHDPPQGPATGHSGRMPLEREAPPVVPVPARVAPAEARMGAVAESPSLGGQRAAQPGATLGVEAVAQPQAEPEPYSKPQADSFSNSQADNQPDAGAAGQDASPGEASAQGSAAGDASATEDLEEWKRLAKDVQAQLKEADGVLAGLRGELAAVKGWQAKTPNLVRLGQSLATLGAYKVAAADAAIGAGCFPTVSVDCQDLSIIDGIGETYEQRLYAAGIGTFWELAYLDDAALKEILRLSDWQMRSIDFADIRLQAQQLAIDTNAKGLLWDGETPDDFSRIKGIGKVYEQRLYEKGIRTYRALAGEKVETLSAILGPQVFGAQIEQWIRQAAVLAAEQGT